MTEVREKDLMKLIHGELSASRAEELRERVAGDPDLERRLTRMEAAWGSLEAPPAVVPPGFAGRVMARATAEASGGGRVPSAAPGWVRLSAAAALAAGLAAGVFLGRAERLTVDDFDFGAGPSLAEAYWSALEEESPEGVGAGEVLR